MILENLIQLWTWKHPNEKFLDSIELNPLVDKNTLWDYIMYEYGSMDTVESYSEAFHDEVDMFFKVHKYNIDKLCNTLNLEYTITDNFSLERELNIGGSEDITGSRNKTNNVTSNTTGTISNIRTTDMTKKNDNTNTTDMTKTTDMSKTSATQNDNSKSLYETDVHLVSAFNQPESPKLIGHDAEGNPIYEYEDVEESRDTIAQSSKEKSTEEGEIKDTGTISDNSTIIDDGTIKDTGTISDDNKTETNKVDSATENLTDSEHKEHGSVENEFKHGNLGIPYQTLIKQERELALFNIYKWIAKHFSNELLIAIW